VASPRTRTALYSETRRQDLAAAVIKAREHAGWPTTVDFIKAVGRGSRAIYALENAEPTVGQVILHAVGRTLGSRLPGWSQDTPRHILEGNPAPPLSATPGQDTAEEDPWSEEDEKLYDALDAIVRPHGLRLTPKIVQAMRDAWEEEQAQRDQVNTD